MNVKMEFDFAGYATKSGIKCTDGRTIMPNAFSHQDGLKVPLVWEHGRSNPENVLGHAILENRPDGVYSWCVFNATPRAQHVKLAIEHGDLDSLSIYANDLDQMGLDVRHGSIREVSVCLAGANPGAIIDNVNLNHSDNYDDDEVIIRFGEKLELSHADEEEKEETVADVFETLSEKQKTVVYAMLSDALNGSKSETDDEGEAEHSAADEDEEDEDNNITHSDTEGTTIVHNIFEGDSSDKKASRPTLTHSQLQTIITDAQEMGSLKDSVLKHADEYGITNIELLFPEARNIRNTPDWIKRQTEWVAKVIGGAHKSPFSRIKSMSADITLETARAKGYIKGRMKKDEFFGLAKRVTTPKTIYKKQKLDRDDMIDITDFDVVVWLKAEMRLMLEEELARAILISDGREVDDEDKINEDNIRPIAKDADFYAHRVNVAVDSDVDGLIETIIRSRKNYKGTGSPTFFTTEDYLTDMLLLKDTTGRRIYRNVAELASELRVSEIVPVEVMEGYQDDDGHDLIGIMVNMRDYTIGADRGGELNFFDDFDIDYNQYKYLYELRCSGALTLPKSAVVLWRGAGTAIAAPTAPTFASATNTITIPTVTNVSYEIGSNEVTGSVVITEDTLVEAVPDEGYHFPAGTTNTWVYEYNPDA